MPVKFIAVNNSDDKELVVSPTEDEYLTYYEEVWPEDTQLKVGLAADVYDNDQECTITTTLPTDFNTSTKYNKLWVETGHGFIDRAGEVNADEYFTGSIDVKFTPYNFSEFRLFDNYYAIPYRGVLDVYFRPYGETSYVPIKIHGTSGSIITSNRSEFICTAKRKGKIGDYSVFHVGDLALVCNDPTTATRYEIDCKVYFNRELFYICAFAAVPARTATWTVKSFKLNDNPLTYINYDNTYPYIAPELEPLPEPEPPTPVVKEINFKRYWWKMAAAGAEATRCMIMSNTTTYKNAEATLINQTPTPAGWYLTPIYESELDKFKAYIDGTLTEAYTFGNALKGNERFVLYNPERNLIYSTKNQKPTSSATQLQVQAFAQSTSSYLNYIALFDANTSYLATVVSNYYNIKTGAIGALGYTYYIGSQSSSTTTIPLYMAVSSTSSNIALRQYKTPEYIDTYLGRTL